MLLPPSLSPPLLLPLSLSPPLLLPLSLSPPLLLLLAFNPPLLTQTLKVFVRFSFHLIHVLLQKAALKRKLMNTQMLARVTMKWKESTYITYAYISVSFFCRQCFSPDASEQKESTKKKKSHRPSDRRVKAETS
jgi:uncharacterized membrane protein YcgQ (UPF0703/DUF1980 family)